MARRTRGANISQDGRSARVVKNSSLRLLIGFLLTLALAAGTLGCGANSLTESQSTAGQLKGTWVEPIAIPGESLDMILATHDTVVAGTGSDSFEAGHSVTTTVAGLVSGRTIDLDVTFDYGQVMHFQGGLIGLTRLRGIWNPTPVGDPVEIEFGKVQ